MLVEVFEMVDGCDVSAFATASQVAQHTATHCNTKQHNATQCNTKQDTGSTVGGCGISAFRTASQHVSTPVEFSKSRRLVEGVDIGACGVWFVFCVCMGACGACCVVCGV